MSDAPDRPDATPSGPSALALSLEDGALRRELGGPASEPGAAVAPVSTTHDAHLRFDGEGGEYFRLWAVNLLLTLLTLVVYSAWAKVRKARWFAQHTVLLGDRFDFHGNPLRILLGRLFALGLLALWTFAFDFSATLGLAMLALLCVVGPLLFASAQHFRLCNTSWRGLRFAFNAPRPLVYRVCVPLLLLWTTGSVLQAFGVGGVWLVVAGLALFGGFPLAHARLKQMQHEHASFGRHRFSFHARPRQFYNVYGMAFALLTVSSIVGAMLAAGLAASAGRHGLPVYPLGLISGAAVLLVMWVLTWPYFAARMQQVVWSNTWLGRIRFRGDMRGARFWRLVAKQTLLTLLTCGLYWPYASVAIARYRVESLAVQSPQPFGEHEFHAGAVADQAALGDASADLFGLDIGW